MSKRDIRLGMGWHGMNESVHNQTSSVTSTDEMSVLNNAQSVHNHSVSFKDTNTSRVRCLNSNNCFAISDSTRKVYRRKLQKMLDQSENTATEEIVMSSNDTEIQEQEFSDNDGRERSKVIDTQNSEYSQRSILI